MVDDIKFEIVERVGVLSELMTGWNVELNRVSWNGRPPKYDIRSWDPKHERMSRGITLTDEEMQNLMDLMKER